MDVAVKATATEMVKIPADQMQMISDKIRSCMDAIRVVSFALNNRPSNFDEVILGSLRDVLDRAANDAATVWGISEDEIEPA